jgi:hypothetical protein
MNTLTELETGLRHNWRKWLQLTSTVRFDKVTAGEAVRNFYLSQGLNEPMLFYCQSPWQMVMTKAVLQYGLTPQSMHFLQGQFGHGKESQVWRNLWSNLDVQLDRKARISLCADFKQFHLRHPRPWANEWGIHSITSGNRWSDFWHKLASLNQPNFHVYSGKELPAFRRLVDIYSKEFPFANNNRLDRSLLQRLLGDLALELTKLEDDTDNLRAFKDILEKLEPKFPMLFLAEFAKLMDGTTEEDLFCQSLLYSAIMLVASREGLGWLPFYEFSARSGILCRFAMPKSEVVSSLLRVLVTNHFVLMHEGICFLCIEPLKSSTDKDGRIHNDTGAAISFSDGYEIYAWHGTAVPRQIITNPSTISRARILREVNADVRRVMMQRYGIGRFLADDTVTILDESKFGVLYSCIVPYEIEPLVMLQVKDSVAETNGSCREHFIRVPPYMKSAHEAIAWSFFLSPQQYHPKVES